MTSIRTRGLTKDFGDLRAVNAIDLDLPSGGVVGFVGPNGAGKSTTIRMLLGLIEPTSGEAHVLGHPIADPSGYLHRVGALIEAPAFYPTLTGEENLRVFATLGGHDRRRIGELLEVVGLGRRGQDRYRSYSLGMKQRLGIAGALLPDPHLLVLDEPTNGLDPQGIVEIRTLLRDIGASGKTVFVSSHLLAEIQAACDSIVMIDHGGVVFSGTMADLLERTSPAIRAAAQHDTDTPRLLQLATDAGYRATRSNGAIQVDAPADWAPDLNRLAWHAGITLRELRATSADLERAFFAMTGADQRGTD
ncbi:ABC transporter ATP-binding protein [Egicoccus sp. AB-alg2]|uniref:ABC transporter ATP-binding protein n=1 Tax=Egicoccus sp. AB-alg2 TaxID=3242693 RepID=UPI00359EE7CB